MKLETFYWKPQTGWSIERFPPLDSEQTLVLLWGTSSLINNPVPLQQIQQAYPNSHLIGCSTAGEIFGASLLDDSLCVSVTQFQQTPLRSVSCSLKSEVGEISSKQAGQKIARYLADPDLQGIFLLADGLEVNGSQLIEGVNSIFNQIPTPDETSNSITITGGLAADNHQFQQTWVLHQGLPKSGSICAVGFYGQQVQISAGCQSGWTIFGPKRQVTRAHDNILYELDGKPALRLYQEYLGEQARNLPKSALFFPLAIRTTSARKPSVLSSVGIDEPQQALILAGNIPEGAMTQLMRGNYERLVDGALAAALINRYSLQRKMQQWDKNELNSQQTHFAREPLLMIAISGSGRRLVLGERTEEELEVTLDELPERTQQIGFYSYGEFAPYGVAAICQLHNQTMTLTTIREGVSSGEILHSASPL